jgi:hypothetical protein
VQERFAAFISRHALNSMQLRFLQLLEAHIANNGPIEGRPPLRRSLHHHRRGGPRPGVFTDDVLVDELLGIIDSFKHLGKDAPP